MDRVRLVFDTIPAALAGARTVALSTLGYALAFVVSVAILFFGAVSLPDNGTGSIGFLALAGVAMFGGQPIFEKAQRIAVPGSDIEIVADRNQASINCHADLSTLPSTPRSR